MDPSIQGPKTQTCPMCETATLRRRHCKSVCEHCGYVESCEDNFVPNEDSPAKPQEPFPA